MANILLKLFALLGAASLLAACQTMGDVNHEAIRVIRAGYPEITVAQRPERVFNRLDGSMCEEYRYYQPGVRGVSRQGLAVVCRYDEQQKWVLVSRQLEHKPKRRHFDRHKDEDRGSGYGSGAKPRPLPPPHSNDDEPVVGEERPLPDKDKPANWKPVTGR